MAVATPEFPQEKWLNGLSAQSHRGPDNLAFAATDNTILGHNRLSIIDLSAAANQPMWDSSHRFLMVFNGEIYNYRELVSRLPTDILLRSNGDSEVLLELFAHLGHEALPLLNGMFAFIIADTLGGKLTAVRDRFGVKPLYYANTDSGDMVFASELKTLWAAGVSKIPDEIAWATFLATGQYPTGSQTFWKNIKQVPAGHLLTYDTTSKAIELKAWYDFHRRISSLPSSVVEPDSWFQGYMTTLLDSVNLRFRSDVPVGITLSGGLDSSLLLAAIRQLFPDEKVLHAFTFYTNDERYDELPWVQRMHAIYPVHLHQVLLQSKEIPDLAQRISNTQDEPYGGLPTIAYTQCFKAAHEQGIKVILDGQGIDEAWAGYDYYLKRNGGTVQGTNQPIAKPGVLQPDFMALSRLDAIPQPFDDALLNMQYRDIFYSKLPRALRFNDRASMMHSVELREPFLDYRLVEMAFAAPEHFKLKDGNTKSLLRQSLKDLLPPDLSLAPKRPLQTPQREWLAGPLLPWVEQKLHSLKDSPAAAWFDHQALSKELEHYRAGHSDNSFYLWQWINTALIFNPEL